MRKDKKELKNKNKVIPETKRLPLTNQKVFSVNRFGLAFVGNSTINSQYISILINDYILSDFSKARGDSIIYHFLNFCKKEFQSDSVYDAFISNIIIMSIGYENNKPYVRMYNANYPRNFIKNPKSSLTSSMYPDYFRPAYSDALRCSELAKRASIAIKQFADSGSFSDIIGGQTIAIQIKNDNSCSWLLNSPDFMRKWNTTDDFIKD